MPTKPKDLAEEGQDAIITGHVYKEDNGDLEVIPYFVDFNSAQVRFAPVGRSSEDMMRTSDFLNRFTYSGPVSTMAEKQISKEESVKLAARREKEANS